MGSTLGGVVPPYLKFDTTVPTTGIAALMPITRIRLDGISTITPTPPKNLVSVIPKKANKTMPVHITN